MKNIELEKIVEHYSELFKKVCYSNSIKYSKWSLEENMYLLKFVYIDNEFIDFDITNKLLFLEKELMQDVEKLGGGVFINNDNIFQPRLTSISISIK